MVDQKIDLIIVAIHNIEGQQFRDILQYCEKTQARVKVVPDAVASLKQTNHAPQLRNIQPEDLIGRSIIARHPNVDLSILSAKRVLVTGAAGLIGAELTRQLATYDLSKAYPPRQQ